MDSLNQFVLVAQAEQATSFADQWPIVTSIGYVLAIFVLPFVLSRLISNSLRLPALSTRLGVALAAAIAGVLFISFGELRYGPDMKGGTTLIYNIVKVGEDLNPSSLASSLSQRVDPSGTKEITIRPRGTDQIEITVPTTDEFELQQIKNRITTSGQLEFRVVANTRDHDEVIRVARALAGQADVKQRKRTEVRDANGKLIGRWYMVGRAADMEDGVRPLKTPVDGYIIRNTETGEIINLPQLDMSSDYPVEKYLKSVNIDSIDVLMAYELAGRPYTEVFGDDLSSASAGVSNMGEPKVTFNLSADGSGKMFDLTSSIMPSGNFYRHMAIIMDGNVLSAPRLNNAIGSSGEISGRFTQEEVEFLVNILREGKLPATLEKEPVSQNRVGAGLGEVTIAKGKTAAMIAIVATAITMLVYYQFSGFVATVALVLNVVLIFAVMIFIRQPLSLPGLAGIVLTIGMAVDANVLVFERIREERAKGAADRLAIRNGFDRATTTIIDANLTTLIAAIVLYWVGTEQVRGFAITLTIGILTSMFTAVFCSRIIFEICEKLRLVGLSMIDGVALTKGKIVGDRDLDYMSGRRFWISLSVLVIGIGIAAAVVRGRSLLNIDFTGGTSVTFQTSEPVTVQQMREYTKQILVDENGRPIESTLVRVDQEPRDQVYILTTSLDDEKALAEKLAEGLAKNNTKLITYDAKISKLSTDQSSVSSQSRVRMVSLQESSDNNGAQAGQAPAVASGVADSSTSNAAGNESQEPAKAEPAKVVSRYILELSQDGGRSTARRDLKSLKDDLAAAAKVAGVTLDVGLVNFEPSPVPETWQENQTEAYEKWTIELPLEESLATKVVDELAAHIDSTPVWLSLSQIKGRVASEMQERAIAAMLVSLVCIVAYIWFRFQKLSYGFAAVVALVHDVLFTVGVIALSHWLADYFGFLLIEDFKIGLTEVAAFLAIIGYSLNDTIVIFDRVREIRGRSPKITIEMLNAALNQTLSRTLLTAGTTLLTVFVLYVWGGEGIHTFAFALLIGIGIGTYSSIFIASPVLYWLASREAATK